LVSRVPLHVSFTSALSLILTTLFSFNDTPPTEIYTLSLHDALPICENANKLPKRHLKTPLRVQWRKLKDRRRLSNDQLHFRKERSEEHTSELQTLTNLVCRLLLEKKKTQQIPHDTTTIRTRQPP